MSEGSGRLQLAVWLAELQAAWAYHNSTKHTPERLQALPPLDFSIEPRPYKLYRGAEKHVLAGEPVRSTMPLLDAMTSAVDRSGRQHVPDLPTLTTLLEFSGGITRRLKRHQGRRDFRAAACTGALYHIELYVVAGPLHGLPEGVYHFEPQDHNLSVLRRGDFRAGLAGAIDQVPESRSAPLFVICTSNFWRNAWKYQSRAYRHAFWDSGTILANLLGLCAAHDLPARVLTGFVDSGVNHLLGLDGEHEAAIAVVAIGSVVSTVVPKDSEAATEVPELKLATVPPSPVEIEYPAIARMHGASSLRSAAEVRAWRRQAPVLQEPAPQQALIPLRPLRGDPLPAATAEDVIRRRGSTRWFERTPISFEQLSTMLAVASSRLDADIFQPHRRSLGRIYLIVNAVLGLESGAYVLQREPLALELLRAGSFREEAGLLALGQPLGADAAVDCYFLADLPAILPSFGNRGYRAAQLDAAIRAGRLYLAAYALGVGATGLTFFDDDVTRFFSPHARGLSVMFLIALGHRHDARPRPQGDASAPEAD